MAMRTPKTWTRDARAQFMRKNALAVYDALTAKRTRFVRADELCRLAGKKFPGLVPDEKALMREAVLPLSKKHGLEIDQGIFLSHLLADPVAGPHLCHAMLLPLESSLKHLKELQNKGELQLTGAHVRRKGKASIVTLQNPRYLNAE